MEIKNLKYKRILLKISGEALLGEQQFGIDQTPVKMIAGEINAARNLGAQVAVVVGGGNIFRGMKNSAKLGMDQASGDYVGMLATVMNCIYVADAFRAAGMQTEVYTPFICGSFTELFSKDKAVRDLEAGKVVFFAGGTGHPYFSTDTSTALRAIEIEADAILLAKSIDGVYDSDPEINPDAVKYDTITMDEVLEQKLGVIDLTATIMCLENKMPLAVFGLNEENSIENLMKGEFNGTYVTV